MPCCGQKREGLAAGYSQSNPIAQPVAPASTASHQSLAQPPAPPPAMGSSVTLLSRQGVTSITGKVTGKRYRFQGAGSMQAVDRRDAEAMIASGAFQQVWG